MKQVFYRIFATDQDCGADSLDGERRCYAHRREAKQKARALSRSGDWGDRTPPTYEVETVALVDATLAELAEVYTDSPLGARLKVASKEADEALMALAVARRNYSTDILSALDIIRGLGPSPHGDGTVDIQATLEAANNIPGGADLGTPATTDYVLRRVYPAAMMAYDRIAAKLHALDVRALCYSTDGEKVLLYGAFTHWQRNRWVTIEEVEVASGLDALLRPTEANSK